MFSRNYKKVITLFYKYFFYLHFYFYTLFNKKTRKKIREILPLNKIAWLENSDSQEEQALPGLDKYIKSSWYKYMLGRYLFSIKYIKNKNVLDAGCGLGWGTYLISDYPKELIGIDIDEKSLKFAKEKWHDKKIKFKKQSVTKLNKLKTTFDVVLGYELIEHLSYKDGEKYINEVSSVLIPTGRIILSSYFSESKRKAIASEKRNRFHLHIYTKNEIKNILKKNGFCKIKFYGDLIVTALKCPL